MRRLWLIVGISLIVNACSNASFKGMTGGKSRDEGTPPTNNEDATGTPPGPSGPTPIPSVPPPTNENPNTENPGTMPCESLALGLGSLYQLHDPQCHQNDTDDSGKDPDDDNDDNNNGGGGGNNDDDDDDDDDDPGQNNPGQN